MDLFAGIAKKAAGFLRGAEGLHLASIAKSLESKFGCRIFLRPFPDSQNPEDAKACLMTVETGIIVDNGRHPQHRFKLLESWDHFIFFRPQPDDPEAERWAIAHELGHVMLHWPLCERRERLIYQGDSEHGDAYMVQFVAEEERDADIFACLIAAHRPKPRARQDCFSLDERFAAKVRQYRKRGYFQSDKM